MIFNNAVGGIEGRNRRAEGKERGYRGRAQEELNTQNKRISAHTILILKLFLYVFGMANSFIYFYEVSH